MNPWLIKRLYCVANREMLFAFAFGMFNKDIKRDGNKQGISLCAARAANFHKKAVFSSRKRFTVIASCQQQWKVFEEIERKLNNARVEANLQLWQLNVAVSMEQI